MNKHSIAMILLRKLLCRLLIVCGGAAAGLLALYLVFCLPLAGMRQHTWQSMPLLEKEFLDSELIMGYPATLTGLFTDCLMLENAVYENPEHTRLQQVLNMYRGESSQGDGWAPGISLRDYLEGIDQTREVEYARYWHGYLVILKPLLLLTTIPSIRLGASALQLLLLGFICLKCAARREAFLGTAFLTAVPFLYYVSMYASLSLSICFYIMCCALLVQLYCHDKMSERGTYGLFFLVTGMATSYFDFLTYPLVTLGFPLCIFLYLSRENWIKSFRYLAGFSLDWGFGYMGLWAMKWFLTDLLTGGNVISDGLGTLSARTDMVEGRSMIDGFLAVVMKNLEVYGNWGFAFLLSFLVLWLAVSAWKSRFFKSSMRLETFMSGLPFWIVALYPFAWFFCTQNHSEQHYMFTCKIVSISVFAFICGCGKMWQEKAPALPSAIGEEGHF